MKDMDRAKIKIALSQAKAANKTLSKLKKPLVACPSPVSDKVVFGHFHLQTALAYLEESLSKEHE